MSNHKNRTHTSLQRTRPAAVHIYSGLSSKKCSQRIGPDQTSIQWSSSQGQLYPHCLHACFNACNACFHVCEVSQSAVGNVWQRGGGTLVPPDQKAGLLGQVKPRQKLSDSHLSTNSSLLSSRSLSRVSHEDAVAEFLLRAASQRVALACIELLFKRNTIRRNVVFLF